MQINLDRHPCFNENLRHRYARVHLPVAPECNVQCRFCNRQYDCVNESRPGVTSSVATPRQALEYLKRMIEKRPEIAVAGIAGPGDPFATPEITIETLSLVRNHFPEMLLCVASNGLQVAPYAMQLARIGVSHVTITVNAVDPKIGQSIYRWFRDGTHVLRGIAGAQLLIDRQMEAIRKLKDLQIVVKVNSILLPGINDNHIETVAKTVSDLGADIFNCIPLLPAPGSDFEYMQQPDARLVEELRLKTGIFIPQMRHCSRCRADAAGFIGEAASDETFALLKKCCTMETTQRKKAAPRIAVGTMEGIMVNQHLGNALRLSIFENQAEGPVFIEERETPPPGNGIQRWEALAQIIYDCNTVLVQFASTSPREVLKTYGIEVITMDGLILPALHHLFAGKPLPAYMTAAAPKRCGAACGGNGSGCG